VKILAIDSSTNYASAAVTDGGRTLAELGMEAGAKRGERLAKAVGQVLASAGIELVDLDAYALGLGPGSFTGLRAALSFVKGLAIARPKPVAGASTLHAMALSASAHSGPVVPVIDARKGEVFAARFMGDGRGDVTRETEDMAVSPERLAELAPEGSLLIGDGLSRYGDKIREALGDRAVFAPLWMWAPRAVHVAELARRPLGEGDEDQIDSLVPIYVRSSDAELKLGPRS